MPNECKVMLEQETVKVVNILPDSISWRNLKEKFGFSQERMAQAMNDIKGRLQGIMKLMIPNISEEKLEEKTTGHGFVTTFCMMVMR